jgi:thioesterase domain-containing protein
MSAIGLLGRLGLNGAPSNPQDNAQSLLDWGQEQLKAHYHRMIHAYVPRPYAGCLTILRARDEKHPTDDPALGWRTLAQKVNARTIPGNHHGCVYLAENLPVLAEHFKSCLDASSTSSPLGSKTGGPLTPCLPESKPK